MPVFYREEQIGTRRADFLVEEKVCIELKALIVMVGLVPTIQPSARSVAYREMDPRDKPGWQR